MRRLFLRVEQRSDDAKTACPPLRLRLWSNIQPGCPLRLATCSTDDRAVLHPLLLPIYLPTMTRPNADPDPDPDPSDLPSDADTFQPPIDDPYPDMDIDAAVSFLLESEHSNTRVPLNILFNSSNNSMGIGGTGKEGECDGFPVQEEEMEEEEEEQIDPEEMGYERLSEGILEEENEEIDEFEGIARDEAREIFTVQLVGAESESQLEQTSSSSTTTTQPDFSTNNSNNIEIMTKEDEGLIKQVMGTMRLQPPNWAEDGTWEAKLDQLISNK